MRKITGFLGVSLLLIAGCGGGGGSSGQVKGKVVNLYSMPMAGVTVQWVSKSVSTTTGADGTFTFSSGGGMVSVDLKITGPGLAVTVIPGFQHNASSGKTLVVHALTQDDYFTIAQNYGDASGDLVDPNSAVLVVGRLLNVLSDVCPHTAVITSTSGSPVPCYGDGGLLFDAENRYPRRNSMFSFAATASPGSITVRDEPTGNTYTAAALAGEVLFAFDDELPAYSVIEGTVKNWTTGANLPGVTVTLDGTTASVITGGDGYFALTGVTPNSLQSLTFALAGYFTTHYPDMVIGMMPAGWVDFSMLSTADYAALLQTPLEAAHGSPITLATDALVAGDFVDSRSFYGDRVAGATLEEVPASPSTNIYYLNAAGNAFNAPYTSYASWNRPQLVGVVENVTLPGDVNFKEKWVDAFTAKARVQAGNLTVLRYSGSLRSTTISGTVRDTAGLPAPSMDMRLIDMAGNVRAVTVSDGSAAYTFPPVPNRQWYAIRAADPMPTPARKTTLSAYRYYDSSVATTDAIIVDNTAYDTVKTAYETALGRTVNDTTYGCVAGEIRDWDGGRVTEDTVVLSATGSGLKYMSATGQFNVVKTKDSPGPQFLAAEIPPGAGSAYETIYGDDERMRPLMRYRVEAGAVTLAMLDDSAYTYIPAINTDTYTVYDSFNTPLPNITVEVHSSYPWIGDPAMTLSGVTNGSGQVSLTYRPLYPKTHFLLGDVLGAGTICAAYDWDDALYFIDGAAFDAIKTQLDTAAGSGLDFTTKGVVLAYLGYNPYPYPEPAVGKTVSVVEAPALDAYYHDGAAAMTYPYSYAWSLRQCAVPEVEPGEYSLKINELGTFSIPAMQYLFDRFFRGRYVVEAGLPSLDMIIDGWLQPDYMPALFHVAPRIEAGGTYEGIENAVVTIAYKDGPSYTAATGPGGWVYFPSLDMRRELTITVKADGYIKTVIPAAFPFMLPMFDYISNPYPSSLMIVDDDLVEHVRSVVNLVRGAGSVNPALSIGMTIDVSNGDTMSTNAPGASVFYTP
ncbi:MAG TPA: hypothetical protein ENN09_06455, partial [Planctomycetes bacterium]|nr:hypothetical protein [Planctomycetota bacterium]